MLKNEIRTFLSVKKVLNAPRNSFEETLFISASVLCVDSFVDTQLISKITTDSDLIQTTQEQ